MWRYRNHQARLQTLAPHSIPGRAQLAQPSRPAHSSHLSQPLQISQPGQPIQSSLSLYTASRGQNNGLHTQLHTLVPVDSSSTCPASPAPYPGSKRFQCLPSPPSHPSTLSQPTNSPPGLAGPLDERGWRGHAKRKEFETAFSHVRTHHF